jgi:hypothetical protein
MQQIYFQFNVTSVIDVQTMGIYLKLHCVRRVGNLQLVALLE